MCWGSGAVGANEGRRPRRDQAAMDDIFYFRYRIAVNRGRFFLSVFYGGALSVFLLGFGRVGLG